MQLSPIGMTRTISAPASTPAAPAATALPRPGFYGGDGGDYGYSTPAPQPAKSYEEQVREAQLELIKAQTEAAEAVADAARASQRHWWN